MQTTYAKRRKQTAGKALLIGVTALLLGGCRADDGFTIHAKEVPLTDAAQTEVSQAEETPEETMPVPAPRISVHVCGAVEQAGVYSVPEDARVIDAVEASGGFLEDADTEAVNLAAFLVDGCRLRIPFRSEAEAEDTPAQILSVGVEAVPADGLVVLADGLSAQDGKVNLNTASAEELCTLNGIGPKRAADIIRYREEHGAFGTIEEIMNVDGIKQSLFAKIRESIRV